CAISIAKMYTGKTGIVGFSRGYYGLSLATKSLSTIFKGSRKKGDLPRVPESYSVLAPYCFRCPVHTQFPQCNLACFSASVVVGLADDDNLAAVFVAPIMPAAGMLV